MPVTAIRVDRSRLLQGKIHNENIFNRNNGYHICLGSGRNIGVATSREDDLGFSSRWKWDEGILLKLMEIRF